MSLKKISPFATAFLLSAVFCACSNDTPIGSDSEVLGDTQVQEKSEAPEPEVQAADVQESEEEGLTAKSKPLAPAAEDTVEGVAEDVSSGESESPASIDSVLTALFPEGIDMDTARHEPDSVGVWHFYDPRGTHDNPDFAYGSMTDPRDGIVYKTTTIGGQVWMAENLNYFDIEGAPSSIKNDWCYWDKPENCESAGRLYSWKVAKRVCPEGWRLPTNEDWTALLTAVGADTLNPIAWSGANVLKSKSGWENSGSGTDDFGFTALPAGKAFFNDLQSGFTNHGCSSYMWSATEADLAAGGDTLAFSVELNCSNELAIVNTVKKYSGFSVRCVKDE